MSTAMALQPVDLSAVAKPAADSISDLRSLGQIFAKSGFFSDVREEAQAVVKIMAGAELGFPPITSMTGIYIVKGKISLSANLMAARVKSSGKYDFRVREMSPTKCAIEFFQSNESIGLSEFSIEDAKKAGTQNIDKFPRNMLYARAMSNGCKWFCPDIFAGGIYTPDELGAVVNGEGEVIDIPVEPRRESRRAEIKADEAEALCPPDTAAAIEKLWPVAGYPRKGETAVQPLDEFLKKNKGVDSIQHLDQQSGQNLLELLQKREIEKRPKEVQAQPQSAMNYICGNELAERIINAQARIKQLGWSDDDIKTEWEAHAGNGIYLETCDKATAEGWLDILSQTINSLESKR